MLLLILLGCPTPKPTNSCDASMEWIKTPSMPSEVSSEETFCDFYQFSWQWFLAQTSPSSVKGERVFETNRVYDPSIQSNQCSLDLKGKHDFLISLEPRTIKADEFEHVEADGGALYDQSGNILFYGVYYSPEVCEASSEGFIPKTLEIKTSWAIVPTGSNKHYTIKLKDDTTLGLVGMHMAIWTPKHPEMIWATWQHKENAPLCDGSSPHSNWMFASDSASKCLIKHKSIEKCSEYSFNSAMPFVGEPPLQSSPTNVCQEYAYGNQKTAAINGNDNEENINTIVKINESVNNLLLSLDDSDPMKIWSNYELVGAIWTKDGQNSGKLPVPHKGGTPDPKSPQRGSLELTNITMETFQQGDSSSVPNCFGCHNYTSEDPTKVSHIYSQLK